MPNDVNSLSEGEIRAFIEQINNQIPSSRREKEELEKLAAMYKKDPDAQQKALAEANAVDEEIMIMEDDHRRLTAALHAKQNALVGGDAVAPASAGGGEGGNGGMQARALYDFDAEREEELSLKAGDVVDVIDDSDTDGWWEGSLNGVIGFFPGSYVQRV